MNRILFNCLKRDTQRERKKKNRQYDNRNKAQATVQKNGDRETDALIKQCAYYILSRQSTRASLDEPRVFLGRSSVICYLLTNMGDMLGGLSQSLTIAENTFPVTGNL